MSCGIMFWGQASHSSVIFNMQKRVIGILMGLGYRESCRKSFKKFKILTLSAQYIFSSLPFVVNNRGCFVSNNEYQNINTRQKNYLHFPKVFRTIYEVRTESHEQLFFACELGKAEEGECVGRWNQLLCYP